MSKAVPSIARRMITIYPIPSLTLPLLAALSACAGEGKKASPPSLPFFWILFKLVPRGERDGEPFY